MTGFFHLAYYFWSFHPSCSIYQYFIPCYGWIIFHCGIYLAQTVKNPPGDSGESHGQRNLVGCSPWGHRVRRDRVTKHTVFHCMVYYILFIHSSTDGYLGFYFFMNNTAKNIYVQVFVWMCVCISLGYVPRTGVAKSYGNCSVVWGIVRLFSKAAAPFYILSSNVWGLQFLHIPMALIIVLIFWFWSS